MSILENITNTVEDIFEQTKQGIREILQSDFVQNIKTYVYKVEDTEHEFTFEHEDVQEMLENLQTMNLGLMDEVTVTDVNGNEVVLDKNAYAKRNLAGFKNKAKEEMDLNALNKVLDAVETFTEFVNFENLATAKEFYLPEEEVAEEVEEPVGEEIELEEEVIEEEPVPEDIGEDMLAE